MKLITLLGATGSIGSSTLAVVAQHPDKFKLYAVSGQQRLDELLAICQRFKPELAAVPAAKALEFQQRLVQAGLATQVLAGVAGLEAIASHAEVDTVVAAIVGAAGLLPTMAAVTAGKRVLLANKEALVMSGSLFMQAVDKHQATLLPIDSEHNAIFQCLPANFAARSFAEQGIEKLLLTASGGPFRGWSKEKLAQVTPQQALAHPNWSMGQKISIDSATLMNKGLELIEACWLFNVQPQQIEVVVHPQSLVHSLVSYVDGSLLAQLGNPDMRTPLAHALAWPERISSGVAPLDLLSAAALDFMPPDIQAFPCLRLAQEAFVAGGTAPTVLNAANEVAVAAFLQGRLGFNQIPELISRVLDLSSVQAVNDLASLMSEDRLAQQLAQQVLAANYT